MILKLSSSLHPTLASRNHINTNFWWFFNLIKWFPSSPEYSGRKKFAARLTGKVKVTSHFSKSRTFSSPFRLLLFLSLLRDYVTPVYFSFYRFLLPCFLCSALFQYTKYIHERGPMEISRKRGRAFDELRRKLVLFKQKEQMKKRWEQTGTINHH